MTDNAHLTVFICKVPGVTFDARGVTRQDGFRIVCRSCVTRGAVLRFGFVLIAIVIERRSYLDYFGIDDIERRLVYWLSGGGRIVRRLVEILFCAFASP